jgi:hypothetical protein
MQLVTVGARKSRSTGLLSSITGFRYVRFVHRDDAEMTSGTLPQKTRKHASRSTPVASLVWTNIRGAPTRARPLHRPGIAQVDAARSAGGECASGGPGGPPPPSRRGPVSALEIRKSDGGVQRVHSASTRSRTSANRAPRPYIPHCGDLQGFRARLRASVNARETLTLPW